MYLLDTNVISELRKAKTGKADPAVVKWAESVPFTSLYLSVVTVLEIEQGILGMERKDAAQGKVLREWFETQVRPAFHGRILPIDVPVAMRCAALHIPNQKSEADALIAATALVHGLTVVTRNVADFEGTGAVLLDPWNPTAKMAPKPTIKRIL